MLDDQSNRWTKASRWISWIINAEYVHAEQTDNFIQNNNAGDSSTDIESQTFLNNHIVNFKALQASGMI